MNLPKIEMNYKPKEERMHKEWIDRNNVLTEACEAVCPGCKKKWPEEEGVHYRQVLRQKDDFGRFIYNPVTIECIAVPIKKLMAGGA